jgi:hypothetical protein
MRNQHVDAPHPTSRLRVRREWPRRCAAEKRSKLPSPHGALKPRTTPYHILEWEDCALQQNRVFAFRFG